MAQFYTLREAAEKLRLDPERLKDMAKNNQLRAFHDRGTLRFRAEEIDEMARSLGLGSDPDLQLGELLSPKPAKSPKSPAPSGKSPPPASGKSPPPSGKSPAPGSRRTMHIPADSDLSLVGDEHDAVPIGNEPASGRGKSPSGKSKPGSGKKSTADPTASPPPGHDSDVRLVREGGVDFQLEVDDAGNVAQTREQPPATKSPSPKKSSKLGPEENPDSGVRIVPLDQASDSDVKIVPDDRADHDPDVPLDKMKPKTPSDSDVRLELPPTPAKGRGGHDPFVTEEIELDLEALKEAESKAKRRRPTKSSPQLPTSSPFELSEEDAAKAPAKTPKPGKKSKSKGGTEESSSDFELTPARDDSAEAPIELGSDELPIPLAKGDADDADVVLGDEVKGKGKHDSGINLRDPRDSGISLEEGGSEEFEFGPAGDGSDVSATPKPAPGTPKPSGKTPDSSGEFELSMDDSPTSDEGSSSEFELTLDPGAGVAEDSSSEFELSLDPSAESEGLSSSEVEDSSPVDSDSEFELSLDASGELAAADESGLSEDGEKDIFETDFEVPALEDESQSEAVALDEESDTDLEDSDFELDLSDEDLAAEEESGSQVVALEEDEGASGEVESEEEVPVSRKPRKKAAAVEAADADSPLLDLEDVEGQEEEEIEVEPEPGTVPAAAPAQWGAVPAVFLVPTFLVMIFVVIMSFEMLNTTWGYHTGTLGSRMLIEPIAKTFDSSLKDVP